MNRHRLTQPPSPGFSIVLAINLLLCLIAAEILDRAASTGSTALIWASIALLLVLLPLLFQLFRKARQARSLSPTAGHVLSIPPGVARLVLPVLTLLALGLRFYQLGTESFWYDEAWTASWIDQPLSGVLQIVNPLTYILAHLSLQVNRSEFVLRFAPALAGVLTVPVMYHLGRFLFSRREGLVAAFLLSVSVYPIYHSQELRFYAWQMLLSTLSLYFLLRGLDHNRIRHWVGFALSTALNLYNHPFALFVLASEGLYVAFVLTRDLALAQETSGSPWSARLRTWLPCVARPIAAAAAGLAAYLPQWPQLIRFYNPRWVIELDPTRVQPAVSFGTAWLSRPIAYWIHGLFGLFTSTRMQPVSLYLLLGLLLLGLVCTRKRTVVLTLIWVLLPFPIILPTKIWIWDRYFSYFLPLILVVMSRGIVYLAETLGQQTSRILQAARGGSGGTQRREVVRLSAHTEGRLRWGHACLHHKTQLVFLAVLTVLAVAPNLIQFAAYYAEPQKEQWRELTGVVDAQHQPADLVLINSYYSRALLPFEWYTTTPEDELPRIAYPEDGVLTDLTQLDDLPTFTQGHKRVWLVLHTLSPEIETLILDVMEATHSRVNEWSFVGLRLLLFETRVSGGLR